MIGRNAVAPAAAAVVDLAHLVQRHFRARIVRILQFVRQPLGQRIGVGLLAEDDVCNPLRIPAVGWP